MLSHNLKLLRTSHGLTQTQLAHKTGIRQSRLSDLEHGSNNVTQEEVEILASCFSLEAKDFQYGAMSYNFTNSHLGLANGTGSTQNFLDKSEHYREMLEKERERSSELKEEKGHLAKENRELKKENQHLRKELDERRQSKRAKF